MHRDKDFYNVVVTVSVVTIVALIAFFQMYGGATITSSGDVYCAGTLEDPCIADIWIKIDNPETYVKPVRVYIKDLEWNFQPSVKNVKVFTNESGTLIPTEKIKYKDLKFGDEWHLQLRVLKYKPTDTIKWGFFALGAEEDPYFYGIEAYQWNSNVTYHNTTEVQATGYVELEDAVPDSTLKLRFDEGSGLTVHDENTTNSNDGTWHGNNTVNWTTGKYSYGGNFTPANGSYVDCGADESLNITDAISVEAWVKFDITNPNSFIVVKQIGDVWNDYRWGIIAGDTSVLFFYIKDPDDNVESAETADYTSDKWYHIVGTFDGQYLKIYLNGSLKNTKNWGAVHTIKTGGSLHIGRWVEQRFTGTIDDVRIYNRVLTNDEINQTMNNSHYTSGNSTAIIKDFGIGNTSTQIRIQGNNPRVGTNVTIAANVSDFNTSFTWEELGTNITVGDFNWTYDISPANQKRYVGWDVYFQTNDSSYTSVLYNVTTIYETNIGPETEEVITYT